MTWDSILKVKPMAQKTLRELVHDEFKRQLGSDLPRRIFYYERKATEALIDKIGQEEAKRLKFYARLGPSMTLGNLRTYISDELFKKIPLILEEIVTDYINTEEFKTGSAVPEKMMDPITEGRLKIGNLEIDESTREALSETIEPSERAMGMLAQAAKGTRFRVYPFSGSSEKYGAHLGDKAYEMIGEVEGIVFSIGFDSTRGASGDTYFNVKGKSTLKVCIKGTGTTQPIADRIATFAMASRIGAIQYNDSERKIPALVYATLCAGAGINERGIIYTPFGGPNIKGGNNFQAFCRAVFSAIAGRGASGHQMARLLVNAYLENNTDNISGREVELLGSIQLYLSDPRRMGVPRVTGEELRPLLLKIWNNRRNF
tara:strand:+ start:1227 stop:2345 length:1119 start_codon:yes stop_codon:yes gene_type:complete